MLILNFCLQRQDLNDVIVFLEKPQYFIFKKYFISLVRFGGHWYQTLFANQLKPFQWKDLFENPKSF